jgi:GNAT superfamily N-acetyltransferase
MSRIRRAEPSEAGALAQVVADAFFDLAVCRWLVPDPAERRRVLPPDFALIVEHAIEHGTVHTTDELDAVAVWFSDAPEGIGEIRDYDARLVAAVAPHTPRFVILDDVMHASHPTETPHEYLALLAVAPTAQQAGLGSALLKARHDHLDAEGVPAYLEASSRRSRELYLRNGYTEVGTPLVVPDCPEKIMYPLWREPVR